MGVKVRNIDYVRTAKENCFVLNGVSSLDFGIVVTDGEDFFKSAERDTDSYEVPGRNGEVSVDNGRYKNVDMTITCAIEYDFRDQFIAFKNYVGKQRGYVRLENTFDPEIYQMAKVVSIKPKTLGTRYHAGTFEIKFDAMPQKFLKSGEEPITFVAANINEVSAGDSEVTSYVTRYFPVSTTNKDLEITVYCPDDETLTVAVWAMNSSKTIIENAGDGEWTVTNGQTVTTTLTSEVAYYNIQITATNETSLDNIYAHVKGGTRGDGANINYEGDIRKTLALENPGGFAARPLFEFHNFSVATLTITNYVDDVAEEFYTTQANSDYATDHVFMDCDLQYIYDKNGTNRSTYLSIITAENRNGKSLVFPEIGPENVVMSIGYRTTSMASTTDYLPCLLYITPRWWRL